MHIKQLKGHLKILKREIERIDYELSLSDEDNKLINIPIESCVEIVIFVIKENNGKINQTNLIDELMKLKPIGRWNHGFNKTCKFLRELKDSEIIITERGDFNSIWYSLPKTNQTTKTSHQTI